MEGASIMRIAIGSDHRGIVLKRFVEKLLTDAGYSYEDFGCYTTESVDYPDIARTVAEAVADGRFEFGILICGTGIGMCIAANKVRGIRAAQCHNAFGARRARLHNNANVLCLAAEEGKAPVPSIVQTFLTTEFEGGRHQRRLDKISEMEGKGC
jgi:ribose 5-phosphate isomerase B